MKEDESKDVKNELKQLCNNIRTLTDKKAYKECYEVITNAMKQYPHSPEPHNLRGLIMECQGNHLLAMKHFRAAWALDPTYLPSRHNLELYGTFLSRESGAFEESDCPSLLENSTYKVVYDQNRVGHIIRRKKHEIE